MEFLIQHIEALIFSTEHPITIAEMKSVLNAAFETEFADDDILRGIEDLKNTLTLNFLLKLSKLRAVFSF